MLKKLLTLSCNSKSDSSASRLRRGATFLLFLCHLGFSDTAALAKPELFFYPGPYKTALNKIYFSPITIAPEQITTAFPEIPEMSGVVLMLYWADLCPSESSCNFSIIDEALSYWKKRDKKVVLGVVTFGHPMVDPSTEDGSLKTPTPGWVIRNVDTFSQAAPVIGPTRSGKIEKVTTVFPSYWDPRFVKYVSGLVSHLSRYDGNPTISSVRISLGILGEDNPTWDGLRASMPGFTNEKWLQYCRQMTDIYLRAFKKTKLEFDIDRMGYISVGRVESERSAADSFLQYLFQNRVFIAMNGFDLDNIAQFEEGRSTGPARDIAFIANLKHMGAKIGVEGAPLFNPRLQDIDHLASAINKIDADRWVMFGDMPSLIALGRGVTTSSPIIADVIPAPRRELLTQHALRLLQLLGFHEN